MSTRNNRISWRTYIINEGEFQEFNARSDQPLHIVANKGVQVAQFSKSFEADNVRNSDPFMTILPPTNQYSGNYSFTTPVTFFPQKQDYDHYVAIVIEEEASEGLMLNGEILTTDNFLTVWRHVGQTNLTAITLNITSGTHVLTHSDLSQTFGASIYGLKFQEAYGHALGQRVESIDYVCTRTFVIIRDRFDNDCDGRLDEEIENQIDDDGDGLIDEDLDGELPTTQPWTTAGPTTAQYADPTTSAEQLTTVHPYLTGEVTTSGLKSSPMVSTADYTLDGNHRTLSSTSDDYGSDYNTNDKDGQATQPTVDSNGMGLTQNNLDDKNTSIIDHKFGENDTLNKNNSGDQNSATSEGDTETTNGETSENISKTGSNTDESLNGEGVSDTSDNPNVTSGPDGRYRDNENTRNSHTTPLITNLDSINNGGNNQEISTSNPNGNNGHLNYQGILYTRDQRTVSFDGRDGLNGNEGVPLDGTGSNNPNNSKASTISSDGNEGNGGGNEGTGGYNEGTGSGSQGTGGGSQGTGGESQGTGGESQGTGGNQDNSGGNQGNGGLGEVGQNDSGSSLNNADKNLHHILSTKSGLNINADTTQQAEYDGTLLKNSTQDRNKLNAGSQSWLTSTLFPDTYGSAGETNRHKQVNTQNKSLSEEQGASGLGNESEQSTGMDTILGHDFNRTALHSNGSVVSTMTDSLGGERSGKRTNSLQDRTDSTYNFTRPHGLSTATNDFDFKSTIEPPSGGNSSPDDDNKSCWWIYLLVALAILLLLIILILIVKRCKKRTKRKNSIKSECLGTPLLTYSRPNSGSRSITPPVPMALSIPQTAPDSPVSSPNLLIPSPSVELQTSHKNDISSPYVPVRSASQRSSFPNLLHPKPLALGTSFEPSSENYSPSQGIWASITNPKDVKRKRQESQPSAPPSINLPDVIISVPNSKHIVLKQLHPHNNIYVESSP